MTNNLANTLLLLRRDKGISQKDAASGIGITPAALSSYEKGQREPSLEFTIRIAQYYGISIDELCGLSIPDEQKTESEPVKTRADVMKAFEMLIDSTLNILVETDELIDEEFRSTYRVSLTHVDESNWLSDFVDTYRNLKSLYQKGDIDKEVLEAWKEKKYKDAQLSIQ